MVVVDLGANIGVYTLLAASLVGAQGRVYAFEPDPANYVLLEKNVRANGYRNIVCRQKAVSDKSGEAKLFRGEYAVSHSLSDVAAVDPEMSLTVATTSLDDFFRGLGWPRIGFIKMNIEGWEWFVIKGMTEVLQRSKDLEMMLEFYPDLIRKMGIDPASLIQRLEDDGFTIRIIDEVKGLQPFNETNLRRRHGGNILCERGSSLQERCGSTVG
jgi:FkbM family methyltransferase